MKVGFVYNLQTEKTTDEAEFDTAETIEAIANAIAIAGHDVFRIEMTPDERWIGRLKNAHCDVVFNTAEGFRGVGRESLGPIIYEQLNIPYIGPGPYVSFLTLDKYLTKQMVAMRHVPVAEGQFINNLQELSAVAGEIPFPVIVKPNYEGSSKGITAESICHDEVALQKVVSQSLTQFPEGVLIERFIPGKDVSVGYVGELGSNGILEPFEYTAPNRTENWVYDYQLKNIADADVGCLCPAELPAGVLRRIKQLMRRCVNALGIVDMGRADFRVNEKGEVFFIEFNALPSLQPDAGIFSASKLLGLDYASTIAAIVNAGIKRMKLGGRSSRSPRRTLARRPHIALVHNLRRKNKGEPGFEDEAEFDSPATIAALTEVIRELNYQVTPIEATKDLPQQLQDQDIHVVFNIAEGLAARGRESQVPAVCDLLGIEHTGSDATCMSITLDKDVTKKIVAAEGIHCPRSILYSRPPKALAKHGLAYPVIIKPNEEGTSKGIDAKSVVNCDEELLEKIHRLYEQFQAPILAEEYITGREFTVGVLGNNSPKIIGPMEIAFKPQPGLEHPVYTMEVKFEADPLNNPLLELVCPVELEPKTTAAVHRFARRVFRVLGCRDVARIDFRLDTNHVIQFLEINPLPGLTPGFSDLVIMAEKSGLPFPQLIRQILMPAIRRWRMQTRRFGRQGSLTAHADPNVDF